MVLRPPPLSPPTAETFLKNQRRKLVYPWALGLGTQADGTGISSLVDTEGSKHYQLRTAQNFSSRQPSVGSRAGSPSPVTAPPFPACPIQALAGQRERAGLGPRGLRKKTKVMGVATATMEGQRQLLPTMHTRLLQDRAGPGQLPSHCASRWGQVALVANGMWVEMVWAPPG